MSCQCVLQTGKRIGFYCGRPLKTEFTCGIHKTNCVRGAGLVQPDKVKSPVKRAPIKKAPTKKIPSLPIQQGLAKPELADFLVAFISALPLKKLLAITLKDIESIVKSEFGDGVKYGIDYSFKQDIEPYIKKNVMKYLREYLRKLVSTYNIDKLTLKEVKGLVKKKFGDAVVYSDYKKYIARLVQKKLEVLGSDECRKCSEDLKSLS